MKRKTKAPEKKRTQMSQSDEKVVTVTTEQSNGGYTATVVTDQGNVYTGRDHWWNTPLGQGEASESKAVQKAVEKVGR